MSRDILCFVMSKIEAVIGYFRMLSEERLDCSHHGAERGGIMKKRIYILLLTVMLCGLTAGCGKAEEISDRESGIISEESSTEGESRSEPEQTATPEPALESTPEPSVEEEEESPYADLEALGVPIPEKEVDFEDLQANTNEDIYAWIYIPDTMIDYPVLQHPTDNTYYLNYNLDGSRGYPGCIYTENYNAKDFSDPVTVMYGHNMKNGSMFAGLHRYGDSEYMESHPYVYMYTEDKLYVYEIFASYEHSDEHLLYGKDYTDESVFEGYINKIHDLHSMGTVVREDVEVTTQDRLLTMSTCISTKPKNRFLVQAVLLNGE